MHQQLWGYKVEWKSVSRGTGGKKVEYHWLRESVLKVCTRKVRVPEKHGKEVKLSCV
jgi:hypothetical protein